MRTDRSLRPLGIAVTALLTFAIIGALAPIALAQSGGTLVIGLDQEPPTLDPHASPSAVTYQVIGSVTENLLYRGPDGKLVPWLAESWQSARDGRSVTFKLRRDVKFHDGTPFNAEAVKFNFDRIVDPKFKAGGARAALTTYTGSKVLDEYTLQVNFEAPFAPFLNLVASGPLSIVSPKAVRETGDQVHTRRSAPGRSWSRNMSRRTTRRSSATPPTRGRLRGAIGAGRRTWTPSSGSSCRRRARA
jgi:ABC-type transport system substrate-binding protein